MPILKSFVLNTYYKDSFRNRSFVYLIEREDDINDDNQKIKPPHYLCARGFGFFLFFSITMHPLASGY
jgi:hypothetical protein